ncbi:phage tail tape measure protein [Bacteroides gallinaceum]|uniref:phage tail tape measure protein n=1 Tax=Bacteroides gallinaceum TaxID=1462571 RepID=UPI0019576308|nr:phage tail tape measure protein [Bacteroides gallinaceum]MBM6944692.1 phage tail tape measure protein [Bacteroides gallinaceum]
MSLKIDRVQLEIVVQQDSARKRMLELEKEMRAAYKTLDELGDRLGKNNRIYKAQEQVVKDLKAEYDKLFSEINIGNLSLRELFNRQRELNATLRNLNPNTPEWKQYNQQLKEVNARIKELKGTATQTGLSISKLADGFNRYAGMAAGAIATLTGMTLTMRQCVDEYAKMEEAESQAIKYTGMTREEVKQLNEQFKQMDTRTPREELNRLAGEAGKLGITGVDNVREFVEAANQINVALGEDLGEEAVNQIGKLSQMFGDESRSLRDNMLAIGSAVNQVAQSTSASEPYLVEFTARMGGVGKQAGMSVTDIMGFASALDQNMLRSEMASTALSGLILRIYQEPAKYARLAQMDVEEFTRLMQTDVNAAVISFLEALNKMGGMAQIAPVLKEMQLSGAEAASVISTLAGNVDLVRREQENANKAFAEGTSITNEYNVQNNTVQAGLEKARKNFQEVRIELGERLEPVMKNLISFGSLTVKGLLLLIKAFDDYRGVIVTTTTAVGLYTAAVNVSVIADKAKVLWTGRIVAGLKSLFTLLRANPWGIAAAAVGVLVGALIDWNRNQIAVSDSMKKMNGELANEQKAVGRLFTSLQQAGDGTERRKELIDEINKRYGTYLPNLLTEKSSLDEIKAAYDRINTSLTQQIALKYKNEEASQVTEKAASKQMDYLESLRQSVTKLTGSDQEAASFIQDLRSMADAAVQGGDYRKGVGNTMATLEKEYLAGRKLTASMKDDIMDYMNSVYQLDIALDDINKKYEGWTPKQTNEVPLGELPEVTVTGTKPTTTGTTGTPAASASGNDALEAAYRERLNIIKQNYLDQKITEEQYRQEMYNEEMGYLAARRDLLEKNGEDTSQIQGQIYDKLIAEANRVYEAQKNADFGKAEADAEKERQAAKQAFISGDIADEEAYRQRLLDIEREYLEERKRLLEKYGMDTTEVEGQLLDMGVEQKQGDNRQQKRDRRTQREEGFRAIDSTDDFGQKNDILNQMYADDLVSFEEYQEEKTRIAEEQEEMRNEIAQAAMQVVGQAASSASQLISALQDRELSQVEAKYNKEIAAARKAGKDTTKVEEEKEAAMKEVKKKYADAQFAMSVLQVTASTAVAAMEAYKAMAGIPVVGPALGAAAAAAAVVAGAAQIAVAKQQRDEAKGLYSGGFSKDYIEGYTAPGNPHDTAGVIPVHKNEFVANHEAVANPAVKQFLDVFDVAQKRGTIRMLNTTQILEQVRTRGGRYEGGYTDTGTGDARSSASPFAGMSAEQRSQVVVLLQENNRLLTILTEKELVVDPRKVRDAINRVNRLEKNVSR